MLTRIVWDVIDNHLVNVEHVQDQALLVFVLGLLGNDQNVREKEELHVAGRLPGCPANCAFLLQTSQTLSLKLGLKLVLLKGEEM